MTRPRVWLEIKFLVCFARPLSISVSISILWIATKKNCVRAQCSVFSNSAIVWVKIEFESSVWLCHTTSFLHYFSWGAPDVLCCVHVGYIALLQCLHTFVTDCGLA